MLKVLHTADWHLGYVSQQLEADDAKTLAQARLTAVERIFGVARQNAVAAVLCAGDLFDAPDPKRQWWQGLLDVFTGLDAQGWQTPVLLLPGNHDPICLGSVYSAEHGFRRGLPTWVHVVDRGDFSFDLGPRAVVLAAPCTSTDGATDLALNLPDRADGDDRIRIGLVHGTTFDLAEHEMNFPIARDAAIRRGLNYLAIGDTHGFRDVVPSSPAPTVYPGAPEPTNFGESGGGSVVVVGFRAGGRKRPTLIQHRVARWSWSRREVRSIDELDALLDEHLEQTVLKLILELEVTVEQQEHVERQLERLKGSMAKHGRVGALVVDDRGMRLDVSGSQLPDDVPELLAQAADQLTADANRDPIAKRALVHLHRLLRELQ